MTGSTKLEMLWEASDPTEVLSTRFGLRDANEADDWVIGVLRQHWGVDVECCERIVMSAHNALAWVATPHGRMIMKWSVVAEHHVRLDAVAKVVDWLADRGLPVSRPVASLDGSLQVDLGRVSAGLQHVIEGDFLDTADLAQVRALGATLARLHAELARYTGEIPGLRAPTQTLTHQVSTWLDDCPAHVPTAARETLRRLLDRTRDDSIPVQLVQGDFRAANVLVDGPRVLAVLDFEDARIDHCVVELARSAVLLGTRFRNWGPVAPEVHATLREGYESIRPLSEAELSWWRPLVLWTSLAMIPPGDDPTGWADAALSQLS